jgi:NAD(P)-dependent dehydrogenase (short-subunit alcohol dehydrogenase family)
LVSKNGGKKKPRVSAQKKSANPGHPRLAGKVAVVTGGNRGIGLAIARAFVDEGCSVLITGRDQETLNAAKRELAQIANGGEVLAEVCDVRDENSVTTVFVKVKKRWGRLDILVNNAGILQKLYHVTETPTDLWRSVIDTNLTGTFFCTRAAIPLMQRGGIIVNNLSVAAKQIFPKLSAYNASKHGALGFTLTLREELIPKGIRVTALMPGATDTQIWNQSWPDAPREKMIPPATVAEAVLCAVTLPPDANLQELLLVPVGGAL